MIINCLIVDDELLARRLLTDYISKIPTLKLVATRSSALEAQEILRKEQIDLLFLDIQMPDLTGITFLQSLPNKPVTIFTTAYTEYALKGYELAVIDYLVKPISFERFFLAVTKATEFLSYSNQSLRNEEVTSQQVSATTSSDFLFVKVDYKIQKVNYSDIDYIEAYGEYILIYSGKEKLMTLAALGKMEELLPRPNFMRVHRSFIVNFSKIQSVQGNVLYVGQKQIPVSKSYRDVLMNEISKNQLL